MAEIGLSRDHPTLGSIQILRGVAATSVVLHHSVRAFSLYRPANSPLAPPTLFHLNPFGTVTGVGVDIFFVISGFVMVYVSGPYRDRKKPVSDFAIRRLIRIYPLYALATALILLIDAYYVVMKGAPPFFDQQFSRIAGSLLFIPTFDARHHVAPISDMGWTLYYEMLFYGIFALALLTARNRLVIAVGAMLCALLISANLVGGDSALALFLKSTLVLEFVFGCVVAALFMTGRLPKWPPLLYFGLGVAGLMLHPAFPAEQLRFLLWGVPAAFIVAGCIELERRRKTAWSPGWMEFGEISYAVYLFQMIVIYNVIYRLVLKIPMGLAAGWATDLVIVATTLAAVAVGAVISRLIERPLRRVLTGWYARRARLTPAPLAGRSR